MTRRKSFRIEFDIEAGRTDDPGGVYLRIGPRILTLRGRFNFEQPAEWNPDAGKAVWRRHQRGGLYQESDLPLPKNLMLQLTEHRMTYAEAVGYRAPGLDWIIDEFDASFDELAIASLRYHQDWAVTMCSDARRAKYQDLIDRLSERAPAVAETDADRAILKHARAHATAEDPLGLDTPEVLQAQCDEIYDRYEQRRQAWSVRRREARHDFVDVMPGLWS